MGKIAQTVTKSNNTLPGSHGDGMGKIVADMLKPFGIKVIWVEDGIIAYDGSWKWKTPEIEFVGGYWGMDYRDAAMDFVSEILLKRFGIGDPRVVKLFFDCNEGEK